MEQGAKLFHETAATWSVAVAVLIVISVGLIFILWRVANRLSDSHDKFLESQTKTTERLTAAVENINTKLPEVCKAECPLGKPQENARRKFA